LNKLLEKIYNISPALVQNIGVSLYGYKVYRREYGRQFERLLEEFEKQQWFSLDELKAFQNAKLRTLIKHSYSHVPYYRQIMDERKLTPADIRTVDDLAKLPILTRDIVKKNQSRLIARNIRRSHLYAGHTSGTSGSPLKLFWDNQICLIKNVVDWRQKKWAGLNVYDRIAIFWGRQLVPVNRVKPPFWRSNYILNHLYFSSYHVSLENLKAYVNKMIGFAPHAIEGYPSTVYILARYMLDRKISLPLRAVLTSSEYLSTQQRLAIEKAFKCRVFDFYGMAERVAFATECKAHKNKHLNMDYGITEILNGAGQPVSPGKVGYIVGTSLHNLGMPLIRYQTSDVTSIINETCSCGREFELISDLTSRADDLVITRDGRFISHASLTLPLSSNRNVVESQIIQEDRSSIKLKIVKLPTYSHKDTQILIDAYKRVLGKDMIIDVQFVKDIPRTKTGKFRWVISKVPLEF